eukprot:Nk52_evm1s152 gene=Nk52_evmTU1s152
MVGQINTNEKVDVSSLVAEACSLITSTYTSHKQANTSKDESNNAFVSGISLSSGLNASELLSANEKATDEDVEGVGKGKSNKTKMINDLDRELGGLESVASGGNIKKKKNEKGGKSSSAKDSAGKKWFDMKPTTMTDDLKRDFQILRMRHVLDPKRHYKSSDMKTIPKYFHVGKVIEGSAEFYSSRMTKRERKNNLAEEVLNDFDKRKYYKRRFTQYQQKQSSGRHVNKKLMAKRKPTALK